MAPQLLQRNNLSFRVFPYTLLKSLVMAPKPKDSTSTEQSCIGARANAKNKKFEKVH